MAQFYEEKEDQMRKLVAQYEESGQSMPEFCKSTGITYRVLRYWHNKLAAASPTVPYSGFREINIVPPPSRFVSECIVMETTNGITLRFPADYSIESLSSLINRLSC